MAVDPSLRALEAIFTEMLRDGLISPALLNTAADEMRAAGEEEAAHQIDCLEAEARAQRTTEWKRDQQRKRVRVISDGGNDAS